MITVICYWQLCVNIAGAGMACTNAKGKGPMKDLFAFIEKYQATANIILSECPTKGEEPSLSFDLPPGFRPRPDLKKK